MGRLLTGLASLLVLALIAVALAPYFIDWTRYRGYVERELTSALAAPVKVEGAIELAVLPSPVVSLGEVRIGGEGAQGRIRKLEVELAIGALLKGEWRANDVRLDTPQIWLALDRSGRFRAGTPPAEWAKVAIEKLSISDGEITIEQEQRGVRFFADDIALAASAQSLFGPWKAEGTARFEGSPVQLSVQTGRGDAQGIRAKLSIIPKERPIALDLDALFGLEGGRPGFSGALKLSGVGARAAQERQDGWRIETNIEASSESLIAKDIHLLPAGDERVIGLNGVVNFALGETIKADAALSTKQLDLDRLVAASPQAPVDLAGLGERLKQLPSAMALPANLRLRGSFDVGSVAAVGGLVKDVHVVAELREGRWRLSQARAVLPGEAKIKFNAELGTAWQREPVQGALDIEAQAPGAFAAWVKGEYFRGQGERGPLPSGQLTLKSNFTLGEKTLALRDLRLGVPGAALQGSLAYEWQGALPRLAVNAAAQDIDLTPLANFLSPFQPQLGQALSGQADFKLQAQHMRYGGLDLNEVRIDARREQDGLAINEVNIASFNGVSLNGAGRFSLTNDSALHFSVKGDRLKPALDHLATLFPNLPAIGALQARADALSPLDLSVKLASIAGQASMAVEGKAGGSAIMGDGRFTLHLPGELSLKSFQAVIENRQSAPLLRQLGLSPGADLATSPARVMLDLKGSGDGSGVLTGEVELAGAKAALAGRVATGDLTTLGPGVALALTSSDINPLLVSLGFVPAHLDEDIPVSGKARLQFDGESIKLHDIEGKIGEGRVAGELGLTGRSAPALSGRLEMGTIAIDSLLALATGAPAAAKGEIWSEQPFTPFFPSAMSGEVRVTADRLDGLPLPVARSQFLMKFPKDGIALEQFEGKLGAGKLSGNLLALRDAAKIKLAGRVIAEGIDLETLPWRANDKPALGGKAELSLSFEGSGRSPFQLAGSLQGGGQLVVEQGHLAGLSEASFAPVYAAASAEKLPDLSRLLPQVEQDLAGGPLEFARIESSIALSEGVLRASAVEFSGAPAGVKASAAIDLQRLGVNASIDLEGKSPAGSAPGPRLSVFAAGPLSQPYRRIDMRPLGDYLNLRRFEGELARLETLQKQIDERERKLRDLEEQERARKAKDEEERKAREERAPVVLPEPQGQAASPAAEDVVGPAVPVPTPRPRPPAPRAAAPAQVNSTLRDLVEGTLRKLPDRPAAASAATAGAPLAPLPPPVVIAPAPQIGP